MIRLFEMFAGYGGASFALKKAGIDFQTVGFSEIDKYAIQCYEQNHIGCNKEINLEHFIAICGKTTCGKNIYYCDDCSGIENYGDATQINPEELKDFDLLTGGFPCQDVSVNGKNNLDNGRSILFNDILRILKIKKPEYILLENVKGLLQEKHKEFFKHIKNSLIELGYNLDIKVLNSSEYGIKHNRDRVYIRDRYIRM